MGADALGAILKGVPKNCDLALQTTLNVEREETDKTDSEYSVEKCIGANLSKNNGGPYAVPFHGLAFQSTF